MIVGKAGRLSATLKDNVLESLIESWEGATEIDTAINVQNENILVIGEIMEAVKFTGIKMLEVRKMFHMLTYCQLTSIPSLTVFHQLGQW